MYTIYKRITPDGKVYVGCTSKTLNARAGIEGAGYRQSPVFWSEILRWGWSQIVSEVVATTESAEEARELEADAIMAALRDCGSSNLLNRNLSSGYSWTEEQRACLSAILKESPDFQDACRDPVRNAHISDSIKKKWSQPEYRERVLTAIRTSVKHKEACSSVDVRQRTSQSLKAWHSIPENKAKFLETMRSQSRRERLSASIRASKRHLDSCRSVERNQKLATSLRSYYANEENRQAMSQAVRNSKAFQNAMQSDERRARIAASSRGRVWVHNNEINRFILEMELPELLEQGWVRGRLSKNK